MKIGVIGGGSTYTPELIDGFIARAGVLGVKEIWLVDPNQERLAVVGAFAQRMGAFANAPFTVERNLLFDSGSCADRVALDR